MARSDRAYVGSCTQRPPTLKRLRQVTLFLPRATPIYTEAASRCLSSVNAKRSIPHFLGAAALAVFGFTYPFTPKRQINISMLHITNAPPQWALYLEKTGSPTNNVRFLFPLTIAEERTWANDLEKVICIATWHAQPSENFISIEIESSNTISIVYPGSGCTARSENLVKTNGHWKLDPANYRPSDSLRDRFVEKLLILLGS